MNFKQVYAKQVSKQAINMATISTI